MKKIISLLSVFAMVLTMFSTVAFADADNKVFFEDVTPADAVDTVVLKLVAETNLTINSIGVTLDLTGALAAGATFEKKSIEAATFNVNTSQKVFAATYTNVDGGTGRIELGELTVNLANVADGTTITFPVKRALAIKDSNKVSVVGQFTDETAGYSITKEADVPATPVFSYDTTKEATLYIDKDAAKPVYQFDCLVKNCGTDVTLKFASEGQTMTRTLTDLEEVGEAGLEFTALVVNAPGAVTLPEIAD